MGYAVYVEDKNGKMIDCWKPANRGKDFERLFTDEHLKNECKCDHVMNCMCCYGPYVANDVDLVDDEHTKELIKKHGTVYIEWDC